MPKQPLKAFSSAPRDTKFDQPYGQDYDHDTNQVYALKTYLSALGFNQKKHDISEIEAEKLIHTFYKNPFNEEGATRYANISLEVTSAKGWKNYLTDFYPYDYEFERTLEKLNQSNQEDFFLVIREDVNFIFSKEKAMEFMKEEYHLDKIPDGTLFVLRSISSYYSNETFYLFYESGNVKEIYSSEDESESIWDSSK